MKKVLCVVFSAIFIFSMCGCNKQNNKAAKFSQEVTVVKMPLPPKCKTSNSISVVNDIIKVLGLIEKTPTASENINGGWSVMIKLKIDGQEMVYTIGDTIFTDADGTQYNITNFDYIEEKINDIYIKIDAVEVNYQ